MSQARKPRVLLVDDDEHLLLTLSDYLSFEGFDVVPARTGEQALDRIQAQEPDIILLDISMPGMGGIGLLRRLEDGEGRPKYPVLVLTARSKMEDFFRTIAVDGFLAKPCPADAVGRKIRDILLDRAAGDAPADSTAGRRVLLAENVISVLDRLEKSFTAAGYDTVIAKRGPEVLEKAAVGKPDVVVMKEQLGEMRGSVVASLLQAMPGTKRIPVVLYDESRVTTENRSHSYQRPAGVGQMLLTSDAAALLNAVRDLLSRCPSRPDGGPGGTAAV
jgi:CheY-like chemotaxis protein